MLLIRLASSCVIQHDFRRYWGGFCSQVVLDFWSVRDNRFEKATLRLTAERVENLSALSGVAYGELGAIFPSLVAPTPAPTPTAIEKAHVEKALSRHGSNGSHFYYFPERRLNEAAQRRTLRVR